jgi:hypothetical protein
VWLGASARLGRRQQAIKAAVNKAAPTRDLLRANGIRRDNITQAGTFAFEVASGV